MRKNILITGSTHGIGATAAIEFAKIGYNVGINGNKSVEDAEKVAQECKKYGVDAEIFIYDVSNQDECKKMIEGFVERFGKIDVLINNAGGALQIPDGPKGEFKDMPMEYWDSQIALNLSSAAYCSRYAAADMIEKGTEV